MLNLNWSDKIKMGEFLLKNRICMAALTRQRCNPENGIPNDLLVEYYSQRVGASMILTQATSWSKRGQAFPGAACLYNQEQVNGWKKVVQAVHKGDSKLFLQIFHAGRATLSQLTKQQVWGPSAIKIRDLHRRLSVQHPIPKQMTLDDIQHTKTQYRKSIQYAKECGFDGIQIHGAHGYLVDSFIRSSSNKRTDKYGGSVQNRCRFALQLADITLQYFKPWEIGIKISPVSRINDMYDQNPQQTYGFLLKQLDKRKIGFVQIRESTQVNMSKQNYEKTSIQQMPDVCKILRPYFSGIIIGNQSFTPTTGIQKIRSGSCDMISFGRLYIANPDLAERMIQEKQVNTKWDMATFFGTQHGSKGYTDYPKWEQKQKL